MKDKIFQKQIAPFFWVDLGGGKYSVCLYSGGYLGQVFATRADEGFNGNGYDWDSLAAVFLEEKCDAKLQDNIQLDSEAGMFSANSMDADALREFVLSFKAACEDKKIILDLFSRAEHD